MTILAQSNFIPHLPLPHFLFVVPDPQISFFQEYLKIDNYPIKYLILGDSSFLP